MALTSRITLTGPSPDEPEDFLSTSLGVIFPDDITNQHGDDEHGLLYSSPHLPAHLPGSKAKPFLISLAEPKKDDERRLFSHYLWNASLLLAELVEAGTLGLSPEVSGFRPSANNGFGAGSGVGAGSGSGSISDFDISGKSTIELGAGTALPSMFAALLGARSVFITDYPAPDVMETLRANVQRNVTQPSSSDSSSSSEAKPTPTSTAPTSSLSIPVAKLEVEGHSWGELSTPFALANRHSFDRVMVCDCLWMPWQHANLMRSIEWFLADNGDARAWVVAGFHTGRQKMRDFFKVDEEGCLSVANEDGKENTKPGEANDARGRLEIESIWERDCDGEEREWVWDRGVEDVTERKRWLVVAILRRKKIGGEGGKG